MKDITLWCKKCKKDYSSFKMQLEGKAILTYYRPFCGEKNITTEEYVKKESENNG